MAQYMADQVTQPIKGIEWSPDLKIKPGPRAGEVASYNQSTTKMDESDFL